MSQIDPRAPDQREEVDREPRVQYEDLEQATGFTQVSNAVLRCYPELSDGEKMTYIVLKSFAYVGPETFVGEETLARARGSTVSTISRHLGKLIAVGLVKVRRRGQGKTNIWIIARIPRQKLEQYMTQWRPDVDLTQKAQAKTAQNPQIKSSQSAQAEEQESEEPSLKKTRRRSRAQPGSSSSSADAPLTARSTTSRGPLTRGARAVENSGDVENMGSASVENSAELAALVADAFGARNQQRSIATFLEGYDLTTVQAAFESVLHRLDRGEAINNPIAYFYTVVKMMQADQNAAATEAQQSESERRAVALSWARSLMREWPEEQVQAILIDTYRDKGFVCGIMQSAAG